MTFVIILHVIVCAGLITLVLIQRGRGGGLVESFSGVESMFGTKTSAFLTRLTTVLAVLFFISCLTLAIFAVRQSRSLMRDAPAGAVQAEGQGIPAAGPPKEETKAEKPAAQQKEEAKAAPSAEEKEKPEAVKSE